MIEIRDVFKYFSVNNSFARKEKRLIKAVDGVSLSVKEGKTMGLVGESGSGKTTLGKLIIGIMIPDKGDILFASESIYKGRSVQRDVLRDCQYIFQDPFSSLDPKMSVREIIAEGLRIRGAAKEERNKKVREIADMVSLSAGALNRYPHEFSGGQRQRIAIARAIATDPVFIVCDEPVSSLDVSIQAQILNLLKELQRRLGLTYLFISHDLAVVAYMADEVAVMRYGKIVEQGTRDEVYLRPKALYTKRLIASIPKLPD